MPGPESRVLTRRAVLAGGASLVLAGPGAAAQAPWQSVSPSQRWRNPDWPPPVPPSPERPGTGLDRIVHRVPPELLLYCRDTDESFEGVFQSADGAYLQGSLEALSWLARDWREGLAAPIDIRLWWVCAEITRQLRADGLDGLLLLLSGYRTQRTNRGIRFEGWRAVRNSMHCLGRAVDIAAPGWPVARLYRAVRALQPGGCGRYDRSAFVHLDTGHERFWAETG